MTIIGLVSLPQTIIKLVFEELDILDRSKNCDNLSSLYIAVNCSKLSFVWTHSPVLLQPENCCLDWLYEYCINNIDYSLRKILKHEYCDLNKNSYFLERPDRYTWISIDTLLKAYDWDMLRMEFLSMDQLYQILLRRPDDWKRIITIYKTNEQNQTMISDADYCYATDGENNTILLLLIKKIHDFEDDCGLFWVIVETINYLLDGYLEHSNKKSSNMIDWANNDGETPIMWCVADKNKCRIIADNLHKIGQRLIRMGCYLDYQDAIYGMTVLMWSIKMDDCVMIRCLIEGCCSLSLEIPEGFGWEGCDALSLAKIWQGKLMHRYVLNCTRN